MWEKKYQIIIASNYRPENLEAPMKLTLQFWKGNIKVKFEFSIKSERVLC